MSDVTALLSKAVGGDRQAQDHLYRLTESELRKLALHWIRRKSAEGQVRTTEVIDDAFLKLMRIPSPGWEHRGAFYVFASRNILCVLIDHLRSLSRQPGGCPDTLDPDRSPAPSRGLTLHSLMGLRQGLEDLGRDLSDTHRMIVELRFLGECTLDEIGELLSMNRYRVFHMSNVALAYLREKLGTNFPAFGRTLNPSSGGEQCRPSNGVE